MISELIDAVLVTRSELKTAVVAPAVAAVSFHAEGCPGGLSLVVSMTDDPGNYRMHVSLSVK